MIKFFESVIIMCRNDFLKKYFNIYLTDQN